MSFDLNSKNIKNAIYLFSYVMNFKIAIFIDEHEKMGKYWPNPQGVAVLGENCIFQLYPTWWDSSVPVRSQVRGDLRDIYIAMPHTEMESSLPLNSGHTTP